MKDVVVVGASDHGRYAIDIIRKAGAGHVVGVLDDHAALGTDVYGVPVIGRSSEVLRLKLQFGFAGGLVAIGDNFVRLRVAELIKRQDPDFEFVTAIHPFTSIGPDVVIGDGSLLMAGVIVNGSCRIGSHAFLATKASVDHDSVLADGTSLSPGATTGGRISLGECSTLSIGATVLHGRSIGAHTVIGASSTVISNIPSHVVAFGTPCRIVRVRAEGDPYL